MSRLRMVHGPVSTASKRSLRGRLPLAVGKVFLGLALTGSLFLTAMAVADPLLTVYTPVFVADVIVVPGGSGPVRAARAAALYRAHAAPRVLVTGSGDCLEIRDFMVAANVSRADIIVECAARDTWENAARSAPILNEMRARSAILVTDWFHSRRALGCFRAAAPHIMWMSAPVERDKSLFTLAIDPEGVKIAKEYVKTVWYALRYRAASRAAARTYDIISRTDPGRTEASQPDGPPIVGDET